MGNLDISPNSEHDPRIQIFIQETQEFIQDLNYPDSTDPFKFELNRLQNKHGLLLSTHLSFKSDDLIDIKLNPVEDLVLEDLEESLDQLASKSLVELKLIRETIDEGTIRDYLIPLLEIYNADLPDDGINHNHKSAYRLVHTLGTQ